MMCQLRLAAHGLFRIFIRVIEAAGIGRHPDKSGNKQYSSRFEETGHLLLSDRLHKKGNHDKEHHEEEVIAHLYMVGRYLKRGEEHEEQSSHKVFSSVDIDQPRYRRRDIGQGDELPDVPCCDKDEEVG